MAAEGPEKSEKEHRMERRSNTISAVICFIIVLFAIAVLLFCLCPSWCQSRCPRTGACTGDIEQTRLWISAFVIALFVLLIVWVVWGAWW